MPEIHYDWKGNTIKAGDEICIIQLDTGGGLSNHGILVPKWDGFELSHVKVNEDVKKCWIPGKSYKVWEEGGILYYTDKCGENLIDTPLSWLKGIGDNCRIAIVGISDKKPITYSGKILSFYIDQQTFWFRFFGHGITGRNIKKNQYISFSERYGYVKTIVINGWSLKLLR